MKKSISAFLSAMFVLSLAWLMVFPIFVIWALNTLFPSLSITLTWQTWRGALVLRTIFHSTFNYEEKKEWGYSNGDKSTKTWRVQA